MNNNINEIDEVIIREQDEFEEPAISEVTWEDLSQDIYIIRNDGGIRNIPYETYKDAKRLEWRDGDSKKEEHLCFKTPNGYQPLNLLGPIVTKVIQWNIDNADLPENCSDLKLEPGYLIDLRGLHLSRLSEYSVKDIRMERMQNQLQALRSAPQTQLQYDGQVPKKDLKQLSEVPCDNLYILSWLKPLKLHSITEFENYQLTYLTKEELDRCPAVGPSSSPKEELDQCPAVGPSSSPKEEVHQLLENYYEQTGVQVGRLNPLDLGQQQTLQQLEDFAFITCYIVNLKSFSK